MHYVKGFNINGVQTKQAACIELQGRPNATTEGIVGVLGIDVTSPLHEVYRCVAVNGSIYTWELLAPFLPSGTDHSKIIASHDADKGAHPDIRDAILGIQARGLQLTPIFVTSKDEMTDLSKIYVYEGNIWAWIYQEGGTVKYYTNALETAETATSTAVYGTGGYQANTRLSESSGTDKQDVTGIYVTGYIPVKYEDVVYLQNCQILKNTAYNHVAFYKADKSMITIRKPADATVTYWGGAFDSNNCLTQIQMKVSDNSIDLSEVAYVRFGGKYIGADSIISVNNEIKDVQLDGGYQWANTGYAFVPADYEDRIADAETLLGIHDGKITDLEETVATQEEAIAGFESKIEDGNIPDYVQSEAEEVANKIINNRTANSLVLLMATDIHWIAHEDVRHNDSKTAIKHLGMGMAEIRKHTRPDAVVLLGDYVYETSPLNKEQAKIAMRSVVASLHNATNGIPSVWLDGNHDHYQTKGDYRLTDGENYALVGANNSQEVEVDVDNLTRNYGYIDFKKQRIRLIYLNTTDISGGVESANYITNAQGQWLINTALNMSGKEDADKWGIVVCSHFPIHMYVYDNTSQYYGTEIFPDLKKVICAYKDKASGTAYGTSYNFSSAKAELIATFHGHIHNFKVHDVATSGGNTVKAICIPNGCPDRENPYAEVFQEEVAYPKTTGTAEDTSFNAVTIDRDNKKIYAHCYGAGYDRVISY